MAKKPSKSSKKPAAKSDAQDKAEPAPVQHSLLRKAESDDKLLEAYHKIERRMGGQFEKAVGALTECRFKFDMETKGKSAPSAWLEQQEPGAVIMLFQMGSHEQPVYIRISRLFLTALVDSFFGGKFDGTSQPKPKLSRSELAMVDRLADLLCVVLASCWSVLVDTNLRYIGHQIEHDDIEFGADFGDMVQTSIVGRLGEHEMDAIDIGQPVETLVAAYAQLARNAGPEDDEIDPVWQESLKDSVEQVFLPIRSVLARPTMNLSDLSRMSVGDILPVTPTDNVPLIVGDRIFAHGSIGEQNGGVAFKINNFL